MNDLEARVQRLEDIESLKRLLYKYCYSIDEGDVDGVMSIFTDDAQGDYSPLGTQKGKSELRKFYAETVPSVVSFCVHMVHNADIRINGDTAEGLFYYEAPCNSVPMQKAVLIQGKYDLRYKKVNGEWKVSGMHCIFK